MNREVAIIRGVVPATSHADRVASLAIQARQHASEHIAEIIAQAGELARSCDQAASGGDAYPAGVRDALARISSYLECHANGVAAIMERTRS